MTNSLMDLPLCNREKSIILIDEYDVPLEKAYFAGFYNEMISFIRSLFESALKSNPTLEFAVISYALDSNKERGLGRPDIVLKPFDPKRPAIIIEVKRADNFSQMTELCKQALKQIEEKKYAAELETEGYEIIRKYGFCFCKKTCMLRKE